MAARRALLIGVEDYDVDDFGRLEVVRSDCERMREVLEKSGYEVQPYSGEPDMHGIRHAITAAMDSADDGETLVIYYSGHGIFYNGVTYLVTKNGSVQNRETHRPHSPEELPKYLLPSNDFDVAVHRCRAANILFVIDACREGINYYIDMRKEEGYEEKSIQLQPYTELQLAHADRRLAAIVYSCSPGRTSSYAEDAETGRPFSFFTRALCDVLEPTHEARTFREVRIAAQQRLDELTAEYHRDAQQIRVAGESPPEGDQRIICDGPSVDPDDPWLAAVRKSPLWDREPAGLAGELREGVEKIVSRCRKEFLGARALFDDDPWLDESLPVRTVEQIEVLVRQYVDAREGLEGPVLCPAECALLLCAPFVREGVLAAARRAALEDPGAAARVWEGARPRALQVARQSMPQIVRKADRLGERNLPERQRDVAAWLLHRAFLHAAEVWVPGSDAALPQAILGELPLPDDPSSTAGKTLDRGRLLAMARCVACDPERLQRRDEHDRPELEDRVELPPVEGHPLEIREQVVGALLCLAGRLAIDVRALGHVLVDHVGLSGQLDLDPRTALEVVAQLVWAHGKGSLDLHLECLHPAIDQALREHLDGAEHVLDTLHDRMKREAGLGPLADLPSHVSGQRLVPVITEDGPAYAGPPHVTFRLVPRQIATDG
jgi:hypothetical protein